MLAYPAMQETEYSGMSMDIGPAEDRPVEKHLVIPKVFQPLWTCQKRYRIMTGGRASGKSTAAAWHVLMKCGEGATILCSREYQDSIADSVHRLLSSLIRHYQLRGFSILRDRIIHTSGGLITYSGLHGVNAESIRGIDDCAVCWIEECQDLSPETWQVVAPTLRARFAAEPSYFIMTGNPYSSSDVQEQLKNSPNAWYCHTTYKDLMAVGLLPEDAIMQRDEDQRNLSYAEYRHVWEGEYAPKPVDNAAIPMSLCTQATIADKPPSGGEVTFGLDVARYGQDRSVLAVSQDGTLIDLYFWRKKALTETADAVMQLAGKYRPSIISVDETGLGAGVVDILKQHDLNVRPINFGAKSPSKRTHEMVSYLWYNARNRLETGSAKIWRGVNKYHEVVFELSSRGMGFDKHGAIEVEKKSAQKKVLGESPDLADAVVLSWFSTKKIRWRISL